MIDCYMIFYLFCNKCYKTTLVCLVGILYVYMLRVMLRLFFRKYGLKNCMKMIPALDVGPTLVYSWLAVYEVGPTVNRRWANVSCLMGYALIA